MDHARKLKFSSYVHLPYINKMWPPLCIFGRAEMAFFPAPLIVSDWHVTAEWREAWVPAVPASGGHLGEGTGWPQQGVRS